MSPIHPTENRSNTPSTVTVAPLFVGNIGIKPFTTAILRRWGFRRVLMVNAGLQALTLFACAGTGEFFSLTPEEYAAAVRAAVEEVGEAMPVLAGCGYSTALAKQFARAAQDAGADGLLLLPPYLIQPEQEGLVQHVRSVAESTGISIVLYHRDNALYSTRAVARLAELPNVVGFKDGHGNLEQFGRIALEIGDRLAYMNGMPTAEMRR